MKATRVLTSILSLGLFFSCQQEGKEDLATEVDKKGSVEVIMSSDFLDEQHDIVSIKHKVWKDGAVVSEKITLDTVPTLGLQDMYLEDIEGNETEKKMPKNYDFFVTIQ
jgi:hypothetical protein